MQNMADLMLPVVTAGSMRILASNATSSLGSAPSVLLERLATFVIRLERESRHSSSTFPIFQTLEGNWSLSGRLLAAFNHADSAFGTGRVNFTQLNRLTAMCATGTYTFGPTTSRLPPSIYIQIVHHVDLRDRVSLYQTARTFRDALFSDRTMWNRITVPKIQGSAGAKMWQSSRTLVSRAQPGSVHIRLGQLLDWRPQAMCMWETLDHLLEIVTTASLEFDPVYPDPTEPRELSQEAALWMLVCQEASSLERLSLTAPVLSFDASMTILPEEFLGGECWKSQIFVTLAGQHSD